MSEVLLSSREDALATLTLNRPDKRNALSIELGRHIPPSYAAARAALPEALARELCLTGRLLDAGEAARRGVVAPRVEWRVVCLRGAQVAPRCDCDVSPSR